MSSLVASFSLHLIAVLLKFPSSGLPSIHHIRFLHMPFASRAIRLPQPKTKQMACVRASAMKDETNQLKPYAGLLFQFLIEEIQ